MKGLVNGPCTAPFLCFIVLFIFLNETGWAQAYSRDSLNTGTAREIKLLVDENRKAATRWWNGWLIGYSVATVAQTGIAMTVPDLKTRQDMWNGAATTFLGTAGLLLTPLVPSKNKMENKMTRAGEHGHNYSEKEYYEDMLMEIARREKFGRSWKVHAVTGITNVASGLVTWLVFDRKALDGIVTFAINSVITESQIWMQPIKAKKDYEQYMKSFKTGRLAFPSLPQPKWYLSVSPCRASLLLSF